METEEAQTRLDPENAVPRATQDTPLTPIAESGSAPTGRLARIPVSSLVPGRNYRGDDVDVSDLVESFAHAPQLQNVVVRPLADGKFEVIAGNRRTAAARHLEWSDIMVMVLEVDDATAEAYGLEENLRRTPLADASNALAKLKDLYVEKGARGRGGDRRSKAFLSNGHDGHLNKSATAKVAKVASKSERTVRRAVKVAEKATPELKQAFDEGELNVNQAEKLAGQPPEQQRQQIAKLQTVKKASDVTTEIEQAEKSLARVTSQLKAFREKKARPGMVKVEIINRLKAAVVALAQEVAAIEKVNAGTNPEGLP